MLVRCLIYGVEHTRSSDNLKQGNTGPGLDVGIAKVVAAMGEIKFKKADGSSCDIPLCPGLSTPHGLCSAGELETPVYLGAAGSPRLDPYATMHL
jgi:hypothetical protein